MSTKPLVIYHGNCADGFTAAWLANMYFAPSEAGRLDAWHVDHHAGVYHEPPPDVIGRTVFILDFSFVPAVMLEIADKAAEVIWIDHHASAIKDMEGIEHPRLKKLLSIERSGAYLTSKYFWPEAEPQDMVRLVDDRDRWVFADPRTRQFHASLFSRPYRIGEWNKLSMDIEKAVAEGEAIDRKHWKDIRELLDVMTTWEGIGGVSVPTANLSYISASDACHELLERHPEAPFAASWYVRKDGKKVYSLRSRPGSEVDVGALAKKFGGGGHKHASGFAV